MNDLKLRRVQVFWEFKNGLCGASGNIRYSVDGGEKNVIAPFDADFAEIGVPSYLEYIETILFCLQTATVAVRDVAKTPNRRTPLMAHGVIPRGFSQLKNFGVAFVFGTDEEELEIHTSDQPWNDTTLSFRGHPVMEGRGLSWALEINAKAELLRYFENSPRAVEISASLLDALEESLNADADRTRKLEEAKAGSGWLKNWLN